MSTGAPPNTDGAPTTDQSTIPQQEPGDSWDGDKMFNIYIFDYCNKRGYKDTAAALKREAHVPEDSHPPINAKQGLLFEWWSVFWVLFSAKSSGTGSEDALLYTQYQSHQRQGEGNRGALPNRTPQAQPPGQTRLVNGVRPGVQGGPMSNGMPPGTTLQGSQQHMANGIANAYPGGVPQVNGISNAPNGPSIGTPAQPMIPGQQRPGVPPQRGPNGVPFRSPTMAPSPQNPGQSQPGQPQNAMGGPSGPQHMARGPMGPPNGQPGMPGGPMSGGPQMPPGSFPQLASTSQPNSPASHGVTAPSPLLANRQVQPRNAGQTEQARQLHEASINQELFKIEAAKLPELKAELSLGNKDLPSLTLEDKSRIIGLAKARHLLPIKPGTAAGPSNSNQPNQPPNQGRPIGQSPLTAAGQIQRTGKRSSTSPGEDGDSLQNDSPPKKQRKSPASNEQPQQQQPPMTPMVPFNQPAMPRQPHGPPNSGLIPQGMPVPFAGVPQVSNPPGMSMQMGPMGTPHMNNAMMGQHPPVTPQMQQHPPQYRQTMHALHKNNLPGGPHGMGVPNAGSPAAADSPYNGDGQSRPGTGQYGGQGPPQNRPGMPPMKAMHPPPSPGMNKNVPGMQVKSEPVDGMNSSPRNAAAVPGQQPQLGQPGPSASGHGGLMNGGGNTAPPTPGGPPSLNTSQPMSQGPPSSQSAPPTTDMFGTDINFNAFDTLDPSMFGTGDGSLGFGSVDFSTADLSEWFNEAGFSNGELK